MKEYVTDQLWILCLLSRTMANKYQSAHTVTKPVMFFKHPCLISNLLASLKSDECFDLHPFLPTPSALAPPHIL